MSIKNRTMEITEQELRKAQEEVSLQLHENKEKWNQALLMEIQQTHPYVSNVLLSDFSTTIQVKRLDSNHTHDLSIYNDRKHRDPLDLFIPKLSWFSTSVKAEDKDILNYLELLGDIAKQLQNVESSMLFTKIGEYMAQHSALNDQLSTLSSEIIIIERDRKAKEKEQKLAEFTYRLKNIKAGQLFFKPLYRRRQEETDINVRAYDVVAIWKVSAKTISFTYDKCSDKYDLAHVEDEYTSKSRWKIEKMFALLEKYQEATHDEMASLVDKVYIRRLIKEARRNGNETREAIRGYLLEVWFKDNDLYQLDDKLKELMDNELLSI